MTQTGTIFSDTDVSGTTSRPGTGLFGSMRFDRKKSLRESIAREKTRQAAVKLDDLATKSERILFRSSNVFPFVLFTDEVIIDELKVNVVYRQFFFTEQVRSILIKDIVNVVVETGPLFATLKITDRTTTTDSNVITNLLTVEYLPKAKAIHARRLIQGLKISHEENVDLANFNIGELRAKLEEIGKAREEPFGTT